MKQLKTVLSISLFSLLGRPLQAQEDARSIPFTFTGFGVTVTGTYIQGFLEEHKQNGVNILWGLISWGGSTHTICHPGAGICRIERILSFQLNRVVLNEKGERGFERVTPDDGSTPVVIGVRNGALTFAVDISQVNDTEQADYESEFYEVKKPFLVYPELVRALHLTQDSEPRAYRVPAGRYPLYRDGNIRYWTFNPYK